MLLLFDIDATLIATAGVGVAALEDAGRDLHGPGFALKTLEFAGRLDPLIIDDLLALNGIPATPAAAAAIRDGYRRHLARRLTDWPNRRALPGVPALIDRLAADSSVTLGLLTGNFEDTGRVKLAACGIDADRFPIRVWGDESPHTPPARDHLPVVAIERYRRAFSRDIPHHHVTVIGDTPWDVRCAKVNGCRALAVATGHYTIDKLMAAGADRAVPDLSDTDDITRWLTLPPRV